LIEIKDFNISKSYTAPHCFRCALQNAVEKMLWAGATFTSDSEHVVAAASSKTQHHIYIWNRVNGKMERILEGGLRAASWSCAPCSEVFV
jgi:hypothetical protein